MRPLVSVAIVTYNQREFLRECIESVLAQDYADYEIVVADDGSSDGTREMLEEYRQRRPEVFVLRLSMVNRGITENSNAAQAACTGKYIAWIAGDDLMLPGKLSAQVEYMERHPECNICYHNLEVFDSRTGEVLGLFNTRKNPAYVGDVRVVLRRGAFNGACSNMVRRSAVPVAGFDRRLGAACDWLYWVETLESGGEIQFLNRVLGRYRRHSGNQTSNDARVFRLENVQDHLFACGVVLSRHPEWANDVASRVSDILVGMRFAEGGSKYVRFLFASLRFRPNVRALVGLVLSVLGVRK